MCQEWNFSRFDDSKFPSFFPFNDCAIFIVENKKIKLPERATLSMNHTWNSRHAKRMSIIYEPASMRENSLTTNFVIFANEMLRRNLWCWTTFGALVFETFSRMAENWKCWEGNKELNYSSTNTRKLETAKGGIGGLISVDSPLTSALISLHFANEIFKQIISRGGDTKPEINSRVKFIENVWTTSENVAL